MNNYEKAKEEGIKDFIEKGANLEHSRWVKWQKYLHSKLYPIEENADTYNGNLLVLPTEYVERWERQIATPYSELSEPEKESDRKEVRQYEDLLSSFAEKIKEGRTNDLREYLQHEPRCNMSLKNNTFCDCGLDKLLSSDSQTIKE